MFSVCSRLPPHPAVPPTSPPVRAGLVTQLLQDAGDGGGADLVDRLLPHVYDELRIVARVQRRRQGAPATLDTTAVVHEAYLRLVGRELVPNRQYFFAAAARAMRCVIVDHARRRGAAKRGRPVTLVSGDAAESAADLDRQASQVLDVHDALERLTAFDGRAAQVVECRFFGGLSVDETAEVVGVGSATVKRDWRRARAWLQAHLGDAADAALDGVDVAPTSNGHPAGS